MPKNKIDYSKTLLYKIVCRDLNVKDCYVGHTTDFNRRKTQHKHRCNTQTDKSYHLNLYQSIRNNGGWDNWEMVLYEKVECVDNLEARKRERECTELLNANLNMYKSFTTKEEVRESRKGYNQEYRETHKIELTEYKKEHHKVYYEENKLRILDYHKKYFEENKEKIKEYNNIRNKQKVECPDCKKVISRCSLSRHIKRQHTTE